MPAMERLLRTVTWALVVGSICMLGGCGSSGRSQSEAAASTCRQVTAVLSDGPAPAADPVGYAEAQIRPLRQIRTTDVKLQQAVDRLASDYAVFFDANGGARAKKSLSSAVSVVDALCPGAGAGL